MYCKVMIAQKAYIQAFRFFWWGCFVLGALCVMYLSLLVDIGIQYIPFSKSDTLSGHLMSITSDQWFDSVFSMANVLRIVGIVTIWLCLSCHQKRRNWFLYALIPLTPVIVGGLFLTKGFFLLLVMPWYLVISVVMLPMILTELFFGTIDGEFFVDGEGWLLQVGSWLLFCLACWLVRYVKRNKAST